METQIPQRAQDETRSRIMLAASEVFSEMGYQAATTREICARAEVNIASVNYHFRDKLGLYTEVLKNAVTARERPAVEAALAAPTPEQALRIFLVTMLRNLGHPDRPAWHIRVMVHELANPTPGLAAVVEHVIRPNAMALCTIVGRLINRPPTDVKTRLCAHSIIGQVVHYVHGRPVIRLLWPEWKVTPETLDEIANHIADFSIAALKEIAERPETVTSATRSLR
jgi:TetR/AcrR family transcriptional regulator, regulator of cefoperazone and chloramphenicol sensitivity